MEKALWRRHQRVVIKEEASWRMYHGEGIEEAVSGRRASRKRHQRGCIMSDVHGGCILDETSWKTHHGEGMFKKACIVEEHPLRCTTWMI